MKCLVTTFETADDLYITSMQVNKEKHRALKKDHLFSSFPFELIQSKSCEEFLF